jgi:hypothetical protein
MKRRPHPARDSARRYRYYFRADAAESPASSSFGDGSGAPTRLDGCARDEPSTRPTRVSDRMDDSSRTRRGTGD